MRRDAEANAAAFYYHQQQSTDDYVLTDEEVNGRRSARRLFHIFINASLNGCTDESDLYLVLKHTVRMRVYARVWFPKSLFGRRRVDFPFSAAYLA